MPDPTPTPDTLRAAVEALAAAWESKASRPPRGQLTESVQAAFHACAVNLRAALAASPAPTDTPDERPCPSHPDDGPVRWFAITAPPRFEGDTPQTGEIQACARCADEAYPSEQVEVDNPLRREVRPRRGVTEPRPAAVTAPRKDEPDEAVAALLRFRTALLGRPSAAAILADLDDVLAEVARRLAAAAPAVEADDEALYEYLEARLRAPAQEYPTTMHLARALLADPRLPWAVERATPDPDTLAALLADTFAGTYTYASQARALIAAGVTLNETATTPTQEDA